MDYVNTSFGRDKIYILFLFISYTEIIQMSLVGKVFKFYFYETNEPSEKTRM